MSRVRSPWARAVQRAFGSLGLLLPALTLTALPARAAFTELAITDSSFVTGPDEDFWISSAAPADVDGDGDLDLLVIGYHVVYFGDVTERMTLYRNDGPAGPGTWTLTAIPVATDGLYFNAGDIAWGDYDGDGDPDAVVGGRFATTLFRNDAGTLVRTSTVLPGYEESPDFLSMDQRTITWADVDNDGDLDLLLPCAIDNFTFLPTLLLRNDGPGAGDAWTFADTGQPLPGTANAVTAWGDADADGDLDLMFATMGQYEDQRLDLYRNDGGQLVLADSALARILHGTADWGDYDGDGDLDLVVAGNLIRPDETGETVVRILRRDPGGLTPVDVVHEFESPAEPWLDFECVTWAGYDSDGDVDLLVSGQWLGEGEIVGQAEVYANTGGAFALAAAPLPAPNFGNTGGAFTWFDIDGDGDLDYFVAGAYYVAAGGGLVESRVQLFRNDAAGTNAPPSAVTGLTAQASGTGVSLNWNAATDASTPSASLTYELGVLPLGGAAPAGVVDPRVLPQPGNVSRNTSWALQGLAPGVYEWSVRAVDNAFAGGPITRGQFEIGGTTGAPPRPAAGNALLHVAPNPASGRSTARLVLARPGEVRVMLLDVRGRRVATLGGGSLPAGVHEFPVGTTGLRPGVYFVRAEVDGLTESRRMVVVR